MRGKQKEWDFTSENDIFSFQLLRFLAQIGHTDIYRKRVVDFLFVGLVTSPKIKIRKFSVFFCFSLSFLDDQVEDLRLSSVAEACSFNFVLGIFVLELACLLSELKGQWTGKRGGVFFICHSLLQILAFVNSIRGVFSLLGILGELCILGVVCCPRRRDALGRNLAVHFLHSLELVFELFWFC